MRRWLILWLAATLLLGAYFLLRSSPMANGIPFMPGILSRWCDRHFDLRTLVMVFVMTLVPSLALSRDHVTRWKVEAVLTVFFLAAEVAQIWIPHRTFSWWDMCYSVLGVVFAEIAALVLWRLEKLRNK